MLELDQFAGASRMKILRRIGFGERNGGAEAGAARTNNRHIRSDRFHRRVGALRSL